MKVKTKTNKNSSKKAENAESKNNHQQEEEKETMETQTTSSDQIEESAEVEESEQPQENDEEEEEVEDEVMNFTEMGIDDRILLAIIQQGWSEPTPIQETAIPLILEGKDILAKARTGSGKTGAYAVPLLNKILTIKKLKSAKQSTSALVLTPSRELCNQAYKNLQELTIYCQREISVVDISSTHVNFQAQKQLLATKPDIIVSTPTKILAHLESQTGDNNSTPSPFAFEIKQTLEMLVIDEADLLLSFGYEEEMKSLVNFLPKNIQTILLSATLNDEVQTVKSLYLHNPAVLKLKDSAELPDPIQLEQYQISCHDEEDKFVLLYSIMKLQLIKGKSLVFVNTVNRCYK
jgi:ATP-dependent RNA helicase DDX56/DBP9